MSSNTEPERDMFGFHIKEKRRKPVRSLNCRSCTTPLTEEELATGDVYCHLEGCQRTKDVREAKLAYYGTVKRPRMGK